MQGEDWPVSYADIPNLKLIEERIAAIEARLQALERKRPYYSTDPDDYEEAVPAITIALGRYARKIGKRG